ncbi:ComEC/Rec2 family competence protein [Parvularcula marina]|uniref:ComEC/Rec2 family competence protein n=2 Tax=Parvularcula marina TaxID=2292771 RepID=UPI00355AA5FC
MTGAGDISIGARGRPRPKEGAKERLLAAGRLARDWAAVETGRFILWAPVLMIAGVTVYFALPTEPSLPLVLLATLLPAAGWIWASRRGAAYSSFGSRLIFFFLLGLLLATIRTASVSAPILPRAVGPTGIEGTLLLREDRPGDQRFTIAPDTIGALTEDQIPEKIRVTWRGDRMDVHPGDRVRVFGQLMPPPGPALPGGFDYGRQLYYDRIGAVGFLYAQPEIKAAASRNSLHIRIERLRDRIAARIERLTPGAGAPIAATLVTGQRDGIPPEITNILRDTGLAHLLAISGLHMGLVCGLLFFSLRFIFACHPGWTARYPIKKWAAVGAILGGIVYLAISGAPVSAQRAFIMAVIGFLAILAERRAISLRNVAIAAVVIIILSPEAVMGAGFQMSFAAVTALVAAYEFVHEQQWTPRDRRLPTRFLRFIGALFLTSLIAGMATSPMSMFHFNRIAVYGLGANMAVMPLFTLIVMPGAVLGLVLMPLGLDQFVWPVVGWALSTIIQVTDMIAARPGAVMPIAQWSGLAWGLVMGGMLILCLFRAAWRWAGVGVILLGMGLAPLSPQPVLLISEDLRNIGAVDQAGELSILSPQRARFTVDQWRESLAVTKEKRELEKFACEEGVCQVPAYGLDVTYTETIEATARACREAEIVIAPLWTAEDLKTSCAALLITKETSAARGPISFYLTREGYRLKEGAPLRGDRPWVP